MHTLEKLAAIGVAAILPIPALAGEAALTPQPEANDGNWCSWISGKPGVLYKNDDNPYVQKLEVFGRFHWQYGHVDAEDANGDSFDYQVEEVRRFRLGAGMKFLNHWDIRANADLTSDNATRGVDFGQNNLGYKGLFEAKLTFNAASAFDLDAVDTLTIAAGRHLLQQSGEFAVSSRFIKTVERSALGNYGHPGNSTGLVVKASKDELSGHLGIYSGDASQEFSRFTTSQIYGGNLRYDYSQAAGFDKAYVDWRMLYNADTQVNQTYKQEWTSSLNTMIEHDRWTFLGDFMIIKNGKQSDANYERGGNIWGISVIPTYYLIQDKLEAAFRYQYAKADRDEGFRMYSRYATAAGSVEGADINNGYGDEHHSIYAGLNYYLCGDNTKLMFGAQWDDLSSAGDTVYRGTTLYGAFRMYF